MKHSYMERLSTEDIEYIKNWWNRQHNYVPSENQYKSGFSFAIFPSMDTHLMKMIDTYDELATIINKEAFDERIRAVYEDNGRFSEIGRWRECPTFRLVYV